MTGGKKYESAYCKSCDVLRTTEYIRMLKVKLVELAGGKCVRCGYNKCIAALEFHHRDPDAKELSLSKVRSLTPKILAEVEKCDLVCSNCHREIHWQQFHRGTE